MLLDSLFWSLWTQVKLIQELVLAGLFIQVPPVCNHQSLLTALKVYTRISRCLWKFLLPSLVETHRSPGTTLLLFLSCRKKNNIFHLQLLPPHQKEKRSLTTQWIFHIFYSSQVFAEISQQHILWPRQCYNTANLWESPVITDPILQFLSRMPIEPQCCCVCSLPPRTQKLFPWRS